jgi:hypothetical protein
VFFLFEAFGGRFDMVHVWDGSTRLQRFDGLNLSGKHLAVDGVNRFDLSTSRPVGRGIGVSARFIAPIGFDTPIPPTRVIVGATGGDFEI